MAHQAPLPLVTDEEVLGGAALNGRPRRPAAELDRVLNGQLQLEVPEQLDLVWKIGIRAGVDAAELATFARIEPARGHIDILRLDLEQSALPLPGGRCGCLKKQVANAVSAHAGLDADVPQHGEIV